LLLAAPANFSGTFLCTSRGGINFTARNRANVAPPPFRPLSRFLPAKFSRSQFKTRLRGGEASSQRQTDGQRFQKKAYENTKFI
jgi:hypothetical protein